MAERGRVTLAARGVRVAYDGTEVLRGVDLEVHGGERVALTGPSGSGKTVLLGVLAGLTPLTPPTGSTGPTGDRTGEVLLDDRPLAADPGLRRRLGVVFQGYGLVALLTAAENVELPLLAAGVPAAEAGARAAEALARVGLADRAEHLVEELSGGQQQRAAVARALAVRPDVLLADEPTAEQDVGHRTATLEAILGAADAGAAVLLATHDPVVAARCDRQLHLEGGVLRER